MKIAFLRRFDYYIGTLLLLVLGVPSFLCGKIFKSKPREKPAVIGVIKIFGAGNLFLALPSLLSIKRIHPNARLVLITSETNRELASELRVFDEIASIKLGTPLAFLSSGISLFKNFLRFDIVFDLEVTSKLSSVLALLLAARSRVSFFTEDLFLRSLSATDLVFFNPQANRPLLFSKLFLAASIPPLSIKETRRHLVTHLALGIKEEARAVVGIGCSELARERALNAQQWTRALLDRLENTVHIQIVGLSSDSSLGEELASALRAASPGLLVDNLCGQLSLNEVFAAIGSSTHYFGIDSSLLHFARLLGKKSISFWGPTNPTSLLMEIPGIEEKIFYHQILCSPCVHVAELPPCRGNNLCIAALFASNEELKDIENRTVHTARDGHPKFI